MRILIILAAILVIIANLFLFCCILFFAKDKKDKISKLGFGFMKGLCLINSILIAGGVVHVF